MLHNLIFDHLSPTLGRDQKGNIITMSSSPRINPLYCLAILFLMATLPACQPDDDDIIKPSEFTKTQRENLGDLVQSAIASNSRDFSVLPNVTPYDAAYHHVQRLYSQANDALQRDRHSPSTDRWDRERDWEVHILVDDQKNAFILPGGHLYLTTALLKSLTYEHELYYIMAFELTLMNEKYLFNRLLNKFNTTILVNLINGSPSPNGTTANNIATALSDIDFEEEDLLEADEKTIDLICETSIWDPAGLIGVYTANTDGNAPWIDNKDYSGRASRVGQLAINGGCGIIQTNGEYEAKVLANIP